MKFLAAVLAVAFLIPVATVAQKDENVTVVSTYQTDSDGYQYGVRYTLDSTVGTDTCVFPRVVSSQNVTGSVVDSIQLRANETGVNIGGFNSADESKPWSVVVKAKWRKGLCADL